MSNQAKKRGGPRVPGPGKVLGRPKKEDKSRKRQVYLSDKVWDKIGPLLEQGTGATGDSTNKILAGALRRLARGLWEPTRRRVPENLIVQSWAPKPRLCGVCRREGHDKRSCPGEATRPG